MDYPEFLNAVKNHMKKSYPDAKSIDIRDITKNNGIILKGLTVMEEGSNIAPTVYLEAFYDELLRNGDLERILQKICEVLEDNRLGPMVDAGMFADFSLVKENLFFKLVSYKENKELLECVPYKTYLDLALLCCCKVKCENIDTGSILIRNSHLDLWKITEEELFYEAFLSAPKVMPFKIESLTDFLKSHADGFCGTDEIMDVYILTNKDNLFGASSICYPDVLENFAREKGCGFYILPSSIHEVLLVNEKNVASPCELNDLICSVNASEVMPQEILSDHYYHYSTGKGFTGGYKDTVMSVKAG